MEPLILTTEETTLAFNIDEAKGSYDHDDIRLLQAEDIYRKHFYRTPHLNFIGTVGEDHVIVSVLKFHSGGNHKCLKTTKKGYEEFTIPHSVLKFIKWNELDSYLNKTQTDCQNYYPILDPAARHDIVTIEEKHRQCYSHMKLAIIYCRPEQSLPAEMFQNTQGSPAFDKFLQIMGHKIQLLGWTGYSGDMSVKKEGEAWYEKWRGIEIIYHVSVIMDAEGHRRLIGNDVPIIFFRDEGSPPFDVRNVTQLGTMPQVFAVVQPDGDKYRVATFSRKTIKSYPPTLPADALDDKQLKDFLLAKMYNGFVMATIYCPPINRLWFTPRAATISAIAAKYPKETPKITKARLKREKAERIRKQAETKEKKDLIVEVCAGRNLAVRDTMAKSSDPYVVLKLYEQEVKSKVVKVTLNPVWNEELRINLNGVDLVDAELQVMVWDWNLVSTHEFMGELFLPLAEIICKYLNTPEPLWFPLQARGSESVSGDVGLRFFLDGKLDPLRDPAPPPSTISSAPAIPSEGHRLQEKKCKRQITPPRGRKSVVGTKTRKMIERSESDPGVDDDANNTTPTSPKKAAPETHSDEKPVPRVVFEKGKSKKKSNTITTTASTQPMSKGHHRSHSDELRIQQSLVIPPDSQSGSRSKSPARVLTPAKSTRVLSPGRSSRSVSAGSSAATHIISPRAVSGSTVTKAEPSPLPPPPSPPPELAEPTPTDQKSTASTTIEEERPERRARSDTIYDGANTLQPPGTFSFKLRSRSPSPIRALSAAEEEESGPPPPPDVLIDSVIEETNAIVKHLLTLQTLVKQACSSESDMNISDQQQNFAHKSTEALRTVIRLTRVIKQLDGHEISPAALFFKKNMVVQNSKAMETTVVALVRCGKQIIQLLLSDAEAARREFPQFQTQLQFAAQALKTLAESAEKFQEALRNV